MTLLIGTISKGHIVITADGLSRVNPITGAGIGSDTFQKVFPIPGIPIAFAHHGFNILMGKSIGEFIGDYIRQYGTRINTASIKEIAEDLRSYTAEPAETILADPSNKGVVGFWITGFSPGKANSELYEVCWPDNSAPCKHEIIVLGGDAKQFIISYLDQPLGRFRPNSIWQSSVDFLCRYHQALYKKAKDKQDEAGQIIFGGHQHQLVLKKSGWNWTKPPK